MERSLVSGAPETAGQDPEGAPPVQQFRIAWKVSRQAAAAGTLALLLALVVVPTLVNGPNGHRQGSRPVPPRSTSPRPNGATRDCVAAPGQCGYPDASSTGVPAGTALVRTLSLTVRSDGAVVDSRSVDGTIDVYADDVTISRTRVSSRAYFPIRLHDGFTGLRIIDSEIAGGPGCQAAVFPANYTVEGANIHGCEDGLETDGNVTVRNSYIHDLAITPTSHNDGIQMLSGHNVLIEHNTIMEKQPSVSAVNLTADQGTIDSVTIRDNLLDGGAYTVYSRRVPGGSFAAPTRVSFVSNRFSRHHVYGVRSLNGTVDWSSNVWDDTGQSAS